MEQYSLQNDNTDEIGIDENKDNLKPVKRNINRQWRVLNKQATTAYASWPGHPRGAS